MQQMIVSVPAMCCDRCVRAVSGAVADVEGVRTVAVDLASGTVRVGGDADRAAVLTAIQGAGYQAAT